MENHKAFYDLCIEESCFASNEFAKILKKIIKFGYKTIAINQVIKEEIIIGKKIKHRGALVPEPIKINQPIEGVKILNRLTIEFTEKNLIHTIMQCQDFKKYHIFAVTPKNPSSFQFACDVADADIISFNPDASKVIKFNRKLYNTAIGRGLYFEINYSPAICDNSLRKQIICRSHFYHLYGKSKNMIISSGATNSLSFRGPYDITNLGLIFGLSEEQSKSAISSNCADLLNRAAGRRMGKSLVVVNHIEESSIIEVDSDDDDVMEIDQVPLSKRMKM